MFRNQWTKTKTELDNLKNEAMRALKKVEEGMKKQDMDHENGANGNKSIPKKIYFHVLSTWLDAKFGNKLTS